MVTYTLPIIYIVNISTDTTLDPHQSVTFIVSNKTDCSIINVCSIRVIVHYHNVVHFVNLLTSPEHLETTNRTDKINNGSLYCN